MIYDSLDNMIKHLPEFKAEAKTLVPLLDAAKSLSQDEIRKMDFPGLDIRFGDYRTKDEREIPFEAHIKFWDLQIVLEGDEYIGYAPLETMKQSSDYDEKQDITFYVAEGQKLELRRGMAILLAPWDGHRPGIIKGAAPSHIKKIVVKLPW